jgi:hypothetical protein
VRKPELDAYIAKRERYVREATKHAAIALLWQATDASEDGGAGFPVDDNTAPGHDDSGRGWWLAIARMPEFASRVRSFVEDSYQMLGIADIPAEMAGHDLILTANHHGAGFWDRGYDQPAGDPIALGVWRAASDYNWPAFYDAWLARARPYPMDRPKTVGEALTERAHDAGGFEAEFQLTDDGELGWLMVENNVLLDEMGLSA